ncbi:pectinesterase/pectinesterase inhibitor-like [Silene latifolia]|uniref:pectinesterase/pectinesterase inhibitor-like n=1 Tax=Silene latifolia TaxID=37657 RepID=UPI003D783921
MLSLVKPTGIGRHQLSPEAAYIYAQCPSVQTAGPKDGLMDNANAAANYSKTPIKILIKNGTYIDHVVNPIWKSNIFLQGKNIAGTRIMDNRNIKKYGTDETATVVVEVEGFMAQDLTISNTAGAKAGQAVAFRSAGDKTVLHRCKKSLAVAFRSAGDKTVLHRCKKSLAVAFRSIGDIMVEVEGFMAQDLTVSNTAGAKAGQAIAFRSAADPRSQEAPGSAYLGRPWKTFSRTVIMESFLNTVINSTGWLAWEKNNNTSLLEVYYEEYNNQGPRKNTYD